MKILQQKHGADFVDSFSFRRQAQLIPPWKNQAHFVEKNAFECRQKSASVASFQVFVQFGLPKIECQEQN